MTRVIAIILLCALLFQIPITPPAHAFIDIDKLGESIPKIYGILTMHRLTLYLFLIVYHQKFQRWPSSRAELEAYIISEEDKEKESGGPVKDILNSVQKPKKPGEATLPVFKNASSFFDFVSFECTVLPSGDLLVEGRLNEKNEKDLGKTFGKFLLSIVVHAGDDGYTIKPSEKAKDNKDYFNLPARMGKKDQPTGSTSSK